ncbi:MAG: hypothetical protein KY053_01045 [Candidatus Liptonbacteria bacterium]|nr:hypothetical protein [Candidatus Liptonbacteria bacterium]
MAEPLNNNRVKNESFPDDYLKTIAERAKKSRVYTKYQLIGLLLAQLLDDEKHKSLYIKMAKKDDETKLLELAKSISEMKLVKNKGAYFMKVWHQQKKIKNEHTKRK